MISSSLSKKYCLSFQFIVSVIAICILFSTNGYTKEVVSGRYISVTKNRVKFIVNVGVPTPANLIVQHFNPAQTILLSTIPRANKVDNNEGSAKWFFKSVKPGQIHFTLSFNKNVSENGIKAILRYRDPSDGKFTESIILP